MIYGETRTEGKVTVFRLLSDLSTENVKPFLKKMNELLDESRVFLILDMSDVEEVSLLGMVAISSVFNRCRQAGGALKIAQLTPPVRRAFRATNLINTIEVYEETVEALKTFNSHNLLKAKNFAGSFFLKDRNAFVGWDRYPLTGMVQ